MSIEVQSDLFAEVFHANPILSLGSEEARKMTAHSGRKCFESYARWSQIGSLAKMFLESSAWNSTRCYLTWEIRSTSRHLIFRLSPSMPATQDIESGSLEEPSIWPTPTATDYKGARSKEAMVKTGRNPFTNSLRDSVEAHSNYQTPEGKLSGSLSPAWTEWLMGYPTGWTELKG